VEIDDAVILETRPAWDGAWITWFHSPALARSVQPGQFVMVHCSAERTDPLFARAFSYYRVEGDRFALCYAVVGRGTRWLSERPPGTVVRAYGPLGHGLRLPEAPSNLLLVGGGAGIAPLVDTAYRAVAAGHHVVAMMGARSAAHLLPASEWPREVEYVVVTEDGSAGPKGYVTEHLGKYQEWANRIYACGPNPMFQALADVLRGNGRRQSPEILMEANMPCGWGMCYGCAIFTKRGVRLCCKDGPRFNLFDVF